MKFQMRPQTKLQDSMHPIVISKKSYLKTIAISLIL